jgi:hypothetical protein
MPSACLLLLLLLLRACPLHAAVCKSGFAVIRKFISRGVFERCVHGTWGQVTDVCQPVPLLWWSCCCFRNARPCCMLLLLFILLLRVLLQVLAKRGSLYRHQHQNSSSISTAA